MPNIVPSSVLARLLSTSPEKLVLSAPLCPHSQHARLSLPFAPTPGGVFPRPPLPPSPARSLPSPLAAQPSAARPPSYRSLRHRLGARPPETLDSASAGRCGWCRRARWDYLIPPFFRPGGKGMQPPLPKVTRGGEEEPIVSLLQAAGKEAAERPRDRSRDGGPGG